MTRLAVTLEFDLPDAAGAGEHVLTALAEQAAAACGGLRLVVVVGGAVRSHPLTLAGARAEALAVTSANDALDPRGRPPKQRDAPSGWEEAA